MATQYGTKLRIHGSGGILISPQFTSDLEKICQRENKAVFYLELNKDISNEIKEKINDIVQDEIKNHDIITKHLINNKIKLNSY